MPDVNSRDEMLKRHATLLADTVREAGALALQMSRNELKTWIKGKSSPVSEADIAVNDLIEGHLRKATPDFGWLSEESVDAAARLTATFTWIVDPIDGTRAYLAGRQDWSVSVALVENGSPVLACIFAPATDEFFFAVKHLGATRNGAHIHATSGTSIDLPRIAGPKPLFERLGFLKDGDNFHPRIGSLALRLVRVADGTLDAAFAGGNSRDWDLAAADLIVHEARGRMSDLNGETLVYNCADVSHGLLVAAGHMRHAHIVEHARKHLVS